MRWIVACVVAIGAAVVVAFAVDFATNTVGILARVFLFLGVAGPPLLVAARFRVWQAVLIAAAPALVLFLLGLASIHSDWGSRTAAGSEDWTNAGSALIEGLLGVLATLIGAVLAIPAVVLDHRRPVSPTA